MSNGKESCGNCFFYHKSVLQMQEPGRCRAHPPSMVVPQPNGTLSISQMPVDPGLWCGEYKAKAKVVA